MNKYKQHKKIQRVGEHERKYVEEVLSTNFSSSKGVNMLGRLEKAFTEKIGSSYAIGHTNGTATLHSALYAAGVRAGDEVIVSSLTMSATAMAVLQADAIPVFADVDSDTFQIDPKSIEDRVTSRTKAIITVALYGLSPDMDPIMEIAQRYGLKVIEDDAQSVLALYKGRMVGTIGHLSSFSFQSSKHLSSGEGGMVCTDDPDLADIVRRFSVLGYAGVSRKTGKITKDDIQNPNYDRHISMGFNYRMSELCAAVALGQVEHMEELVQRRIDVANLFGESIGDCSWLRPQVTPHNQTNSFWALAVRIVHPSVSWVEFRKKFMELGGDGVYAAWKLSYLEPMFRPNTLDFSGKEKIFNVMNGIPDYFIGLCPVAEKIQKEILAFKTNYWDWDIAKKQAKILRNTISFYK